MTKVTENIQQKLRKLPSVHVLMENPELSALTSNLPRKIVIEATRAVLEQKRRAIIEGEAEPPTENALIGEILEMAKRLSSSTLRPVVNATGVIVHTNLGRSILPEEAVEAIERIARAYSTLEYDLEQGKRGSRYVHAERLLRDITGAEAALVVNNNAGAVLLVLNTLASNR
jgi:L-seryl-tRNA(Ser) seleniumtransferase